MVDEIVLLVCDDCNLILLGEGEGHICMHCENPLVSAKFMRQPTKHAPDVCPVCRGKKLVQTKNRGVINCASCNGTGQRR